MAALAGRRRWLKGRVSSVEHEYDCRSIIIRLLDFR
jgi:hypothetical protein